MTRRRRRNAGRPYTVRKNAPKKKTKTRNLTETSQKSLFLSKESFKAVRDPNQMLMNNQSEVGEDDSEMTGSCEKISTRPHPPRKLKVRESEIIQKLLLKHGDNIQVSGNLKEAYFEYSVLEDGYGHATESLSVNLSSTGKADRIISILGPAQKQQYNSEALFTMVQRPITYSATDVH